MKQVQNWRTDATCKPNNGQVPKENIMAATIEFAYTLSDKYCDDQFVGTGDRPAQNGTISIDGASLGQDARAAYVVLGKPRNLGEFDNIPSLQDIEGRLLAKLEDRQKEWDKKVSAAEKQLKELESCPIEKLAEKADIKVYGIDDKIAEEIRYQERIDALNKKANTYAQEKYEKMAEQLERLTDDELCKPIDIPHSKNNWYDSDQRIWMHGISRVSNDIFKRLASVNARRMQIIEQRTEAGKVKAQQEKDNWIAQHGSERLKKAHEKGYGCKRLYIEERAQHEYPEFALDYNDDAEWGDRTCPSLHALNEQEKYEGSEIVWIKIRHDYDPEIDYYNIHGEDYPGEEAVVIRGFLGEYDLIKYLGDPEA